VRSARPGPRRPGTRLRCAVAVAWAGYDWSAARPLFHATVEKLQLNYWGVEKLNSPFSRTSLIDPPRTVCVGYGPVHA